MAGIDFAFLWRSHVGDNAPIGMAQDTGGTNPAAFDGDAISYIADPLSPVPLTTTGQPFILRFAEDGTPYAETNTLAFLKEETSVLTQPFAIVIALRVPYGNAGNSGVVGSFTSFTGMYLGAGQVQPRILAGSNLLGTESVQAWSTAAGVFDGASSSIGGVTGNAGSDGMTGICLNAWNGGSEVGTMDVVAVAVLNDVTKVTTVRNYFQTLLPDPLPDPLAGIAYRLRFEATWDKVTLRPMWQDVARTIPVAVEGDLVATMGEEDAELVPEQSDDSKQGLMLLAADGTPYIDLDGADDWYSLSSFGGPVTYTLLINPRPWTGYWSPCDNSAANADHLGAMDAFTTAFQPGLAPASARRDGVDLTFPFDLAPLEEWAVWTVVTASPPASLRGLFQLAQTWFGPVSVRAFFIHDGTPSTGDRDTVEAFYETLKPAP